MASKIMNRDKQFGLVMAWHNATQIVTEFSADMLGYVNEFIPLFRYAKDGTLVPHAATGEGVIPEASGHSGGRKEDYAYNWGSVVSSDDEMPCGNGQPINNSTYSLQTAEEDFDLMFKVIEGTNHKVVSLGTVNNRGRHFISVELDGGKINVEHREFGHYANLFGSVDKTLPLVYSQSTVCTVCDNTLQANALISVQRMKDKGMKFNGAARIPHTKNMESAIGKLKQNLELSIGVAAEFQLVLMELQAQPVKVDDAAAVYAGFLGEGKDSLSTRMQNDVDSLVNLFRNGKGNEGKNRLDLLSGVTEMYTVGDGRHSTKTPLARWESSEFGTYATRKSEFAEMLVDEKKFEKARNHGAALMLTV